MDRPTGAARPAPRGRRPWTALTSAGLLVAVQALALALGGVAYAVSGVAGRPSDRLGTVLAGALALLVGLGLLPVARGLAAARSWAAAPAVVVQLFVLVVASGLWQGGVYAVAIPLVLLAGGVLYALAVPASREALRAARR